MKRLKLLAMIAAAGTSSRFGYHKALSPIMGNAAVVQNARMLASVYPEKLYITLPNDLIMNADLAFKLNDFNVIAIPNCFQSFGYAGSIKTILTDVREAFDGIIICPVDSPLLSKELISEMVATAARLRNEPRIIVPCYYANSGHPVYFSRHFFSALKTLEKTNLRELIRMNAQYTCAVFFPDARILLNLNTLKDWQAFQSQ